MEWLLIVIIAWPHWGTNNSKTEFKTLEECEKALKLVEISFPKQTNENEWAAIKGCFPKGTVFDRDLNK